MITFAETAEGKLPRRNLDGKCRKPSWRKLDIHHPWQNRSESWEVERLKSMKVSARPKLSLRRFWFGGEMPRPASYVSWAWTYCCQLVALLNLHEVGPSWQECWGTHLEESVPPLLGPEENCYLVSCHNVTKNVTARSQPHKLCLSYQRVFLIGTDWNLSQLWAQISLSSTKLFRSSSQHPEDEIARKCSMLQI